MPSALMKAARNKASRQTIIVKDLMTIKRPARQCRQEEARPSCSSARKKKRPEVNFPFQVAMEKKVGKSINRVKPGFKKQRRERREL